MAHNSQLPCDGDGICMLCKKKPSEEEALICKTCITPWHVNCLSSPPETLSSTLQWDCPDCSPVTGDLPLPVTAQTTATGATGASGDLITAIRAIEADESLTDQEKAKQRQELLSRGGKSSDPDEDKSKKKKEKTKGESDVLDIFDGNFNCSFCMQLPERPVTTPCGHNFCLKCFQKWTGQGKRTCAKCRNTIPPKMASQPRINSALVVAIRMARMSKSSTAVGPLKVQHFIHNQNRPDKAFTTERAKKSGKANACSGKIFVTVPPDHFGPILAENDPERRQGVLVGECWEDRMECRQWGAHLPHVAGIAGQSEYGAQSVALSGGYEDDEDHGEWFLYTGSGGRDLSGNKRTNKDQSFDQKFEKSNEALRVSCKNGYPVRVVRSHKEKRSCYAPESGVRYDGIYRIEKCWRKIGVQGFKVCRYLFVRCDNEPAPWTSDEHGDRPRALPVITELKKATDIMERKETPSWDYDEKEECWKWKKHPPLSRKPMESENPEERKRARRAIKQAQNLSVREKLLKEFSCLICQKVMTFPLTTPCAHNFCKPCLEGAFAGQAFVRERTCEGRRTLRAQKTVMNCPSCPTDISEFLQNPQVNRELMDVIESLQSKTDANIEEAEENVELGEEDNDSEEKAEVVIEDTKASTEDSEIPIDEDEEIQKNPTDSKNEQTHQRKKGKTSGTKSEGVNRYIEEDGIEKPEIPEGEDNDSEEKAEVVIEDTEASTEDSEIPEGEDKEIQKNPTDSKHKQTHKQKKGNTSGKKPDGVKKYIEEDGIVKPEMPKSGKKNLQTPATEITPNRTSKRRKANGGDEDSEIPEGEDQEIQKNPTDSKHKQTHKQKKGNTSGKKPDGVKKYIEEDGIVKPELPKSGKKNLQTPATEVTPNRTSKRRKANGGDEDSELPEGEDEEIQKNPTDSKHKQTHKQKKGNTSGKKPDGVKKYIEEDGIVKPELPKSGKKNLQTPATEVTPNRTSKRRKANGGDEDSELPEGEDEEIQKNPTDSKHKQTHKQKKGNKPDGVKYIEEDGIVKPERPKSGKKNLQTPATEITPDRTSKRRKANGGDVLRVGGVRTRSMRSKVLVDDGNKSPATPLHVQSGDHVSRLSGGVRTRSMRAKELVDD